jgi:hypothetical protein
VQAAANPPSDTDRVHMRTYHIIYMMVSHPPPLSSSLVPSSPHGAEQRKRNCQAACSAASPLPLLSLVRQIQHRLTKTRTCPARSRRPWTPRESMPSHAKPQLPPLQHAAMMITAARCPIEICRGGCLTVRVNVHIGQALPRHDRSHAHVQIADRRPPPPPWWVVLEKVPSAAHRACVRWVTPPSYGEEGRRGTPPAF